jgi:hypothetical protein
MELTWRGFPIQDNLLEYEKLLHTAIYPSFSSEIIKFKLDFIRLADSLLENKNFIATVISFICL